MPWMLQGTPCRNGITRTAAPCSRSSRQTPPTSSGVRTQRTQLRPAVPSLGGVGRPDRARPRSSRRAAAAHRPAASSGTTALGRSGHAGTVPDRRRRRACPPAPATPGAARPGTAGRTARAASLRNVPMTRASPSGSNASTAATTSGGRRPEQPTPARTEASIDGPSLAAGHPLGVLRRWPDAPALGAHDEHGAGTKVANQRGRRRPRRHRPAGQHHAPPREQRPQQIPVAGRFHGLDGRRRRPGRRGAISSAAREPRRRLAWQRR